MFIDPHDYAGFALCFFTIVFLIICLGALRVISKLEYKVKLLENFYYSTLDYVAARDLGNKEFLAKKEYNFIMTRKDYEDFLFGIKSKGSVR
jgi:hypothetical protein